MHMPDGVGLASAFAASAAVGDAAADQGHVSGGGLAQPAPGSSGDANGADEGGLREALHRRDAQIAVLQAKLAHLRAWISSIHARVQVMNPQAIKNSKKLYVGNIPSDVGEEELSEHINSLLLKVGGLIQPGSCVASCRVMPDKKYAFVELRSVEETSNALCLDGVAFKDMFLKVKRPSNYDLSAAIMLGPVQPDPSLNTSSLVGKSAPEESPDKIFVGGLPCEWTEDQVKELLTPFGQLCTFNLVMDKITGKTKGYCFCEYEDAAVTDTVIQSLNKTKVANKTLTVKRASEGSRASAAPLGRAGPPGVGGPGGMLQALTGGSGPGGSGPGGSGGGPGAAAAAAFGGPMGVSQSAGGPVPPGLFAAPMQTFAFPGGIPQMLPHMSPGQGGPAQGLMDGPVGAGGEIVGPGGGGGSGLQPTFVVPTPTFSAQLQAGQLLPASYGMMPSAGGGRMW